MIGGFYGKGQLFLHWFLFPVATELMLSFCLPELLLFEAQFSQHQHGRFSVVETSGPRQYVHDRNCYSLTVAYRNVVCASLFLPPCRLHSCSLLWNLKLAKMQSSYVGSNGSQKRKGRPYKLPLIEKLQRELLYLFYAWWQQLWGAESNVIVILGFVAYCAKFVSSY